MFIFTKYSKYKLYYNRERKNKLYDCEYKFNRIYLTLGYNLIPKIIYRIKDYGYYITYGHRNKIENEIYF